MSDDTKKIISGKKLGFVGGIPVLPMMPTGAQMAVSPFGIKVHYRIDAAGHYVNGPLPGIPSSKVKAVQQAYKVGQKDASYSETGNEYRKLTVAPHPTDPQRFTIKLGNVDLGYGLIDPAYEISSSDETPDQQVDHNDPDEDKDDDPPMPPTSGTVN